MMPAIVATVVASSIGMNTSVGDAAPLALLKASMLVGMMVSPEVFSTRNIIIGLVAVSLPRVQFLHLRHGFQPRRGSCIVESEHVRSDIHEDRAHDRVVFRNIGEQFREERTQHPRQNVHRTSAFAYLHDAQPQGQHSRKAKRDLESRLRRVESSIDHLLKDCCVAHAEPNDSEDKGYQEESNPNVV